MPKVRCSGTAGVTTDAIVRTLMQEIEKLICALRDIVLATDEESQTETQRLANVDQIVIETLQDVSNFYPESGIYGE